MSKKFLLVIGFCLLAGLFAGKVLAEQIDINSASLQELDKITGIGPKYAQGIIDGRPYSSVDELTRVKGIGEKTLAKIKEQGFACVNCSTSVQASPSVAPSVAGIFINEILPNPEGADETEEWFEIYNSNNFETDLSGWKIQDTTGTVSTFTFPAGTKILANGFLVFKRPETKIMLNNESDGLKLFSQDGSLKDSVNFAKAPINQSYNRSQSGWAWSKSITPGTANIILASVAKSKNPSPSPLPKAQNNANNIDVEAQDLTASLNLPAQAGQTQSPWLLFFMVLAVVIILSALVLFIKVKLNKTNVRT